MDDVRADGDVDRYRNVQLRRRRQDAHRHVRRIRAGEVFADTAADALARTHGIADGAVQETAGLVGHAKSPWAEGRVDILGRGSRQRQLEIVNDTGAVHRDRRHESALHQVDENRGQARLDHVGADAPDNPGVGRFCRLNRPHDRFEIVARENRRQRVDERAEPPTRNVGLREIDRVCFTRAGAQRIGTDARQIEFVIAENHGGSLQLSASSCQLGSCTWHLAPGTRHPAPGTYRISIASP